MAESTPVDSSTEKSAIPSVVDYENVDYRVFWIGEHMRLYNLQEQSIVASWLREPAGWFIDLGCGPGRMIPRYIKGRSNIVLVDYSLNNLDIIRSEYPREPLALIAADANKLPFKTGSFDSGISIRLIQNVFSAEPLLGELSRVLRTRAYFVFSYFNRRNLLRVLRYGGQSLRRVHSVAFGDMCGTHPLFFRRLVEKEHLTIKAGRGTGFFYQVTRPLKPLQRLVAKSGPAARAILTASNAFDKVMGALNLSLWQFVLMEKEGPEPSEVPAKRLLDLLACPACGSGGIEETAEACRCGACGGSYPKRNGIYDFRIGRSAPAA